MCIGTHLSNDKRCTLSKNILIFCKISGSYMENQMFQKLLEKSHLKYIRSSWIYRETGTGMQLCNWWSKQVTRRPNLWLPTIGIVYVAALRLLRLISEFCSFNGFWKTHLCLGLGGVGVLSLVCGTLTHNEFKFERLMINCPGIVCLFGRCLI